MAIRVALIGTGNCGGLALKQLVNDARFDLTGVWVSTQARWAETPASWPGWP